MGWTTIMKGSGVVHNGQCNLFGITVNVKGFVVSTVKLSDTDDESAGVTWEGLWREPECFSKNFYPVLLFKNGIYLEMTGAVDSVVLEFL